MQLPLCHNFDAWKISAAEFPTNGTIEDHLRFFVRYALLAPSGHNAQPWQFTIHDQTIDVLAAPPIASLHDVSERQFIIGIGCAIENICIAADYAGYIATCTISPSDDHPLLAARLSFTKTGAVSEALDHLIHMIPKRAMDRHGYRMESLAPADREAMVSAVAHSGATLTLIDRPEDRQQVAQLVLEATHISLDDLAFREELASFLLPNLTRASVGMTGSTLGVPLPLSFLLPTLMRKKNMATVTRKQDEKILKEQTPTFGMIMSHGNTLTDWLTAGRALERATLEATSRGLVISIWAAAIEVPSVAQSIKAITKEQGEPLVFFRVGRCAKRAPHSPRRTLGEVLVSHKKS